MKKTFKRISLATTGYLALPLLAFAQSGGGGLNTSGLQSTISNLKAYINILIPFIIGLAVLVFIFGLFRYVTAGGDEEKLKAARKTIIWGIVIIAVMISTWGLVNFLVGAFGLDQGPHVNFPTI